jgi:hypothetical protein
VGFCPIEAIGPVLLERSGQLAAHGQATFRASLLPKKRAKTGAIAATVTIAQHHPQEPADLHDRHPAG